jgi:hypothetical protein
MLFTFNSINFINTSSNIIIIAWKHKSKNDAHIVVLDLTIARVPSVVSYNIMIHLFSCLCYDISDHNPFQNDFSQR